MSPTSYQTAPPCVKSGIKWWSRRDSNPHTFLQAMDFKSIVSTDSTTRPRCRIMPIFLHSKATRYYILLYILCVCQVFLNHASLSQFVLDQCKCLEVILCRLRQICQKLERFRVQDGLVCFLFDVKVKCLYNFICQKAA